MAENPEPPAPELPSNGMTRFFLHSQDAEQGPILAALEEERTVRPASAFAGPAMEGLDPETAARRYVHQAFQSARVPGFVVPQTSTAESQFKIIGTETVPLTGTKTVKFRQNFYDIPVYGSLISVELDDTNALISLNSSLGEPTDVSPVARISPVAAARAVLDKGRFKKDIENIAPRLNFYYDSQKSKWRLVYIFEDVPVILPPNPKAESRKIAPRYFDYIVDARTGGVVAQLPRTPSMAAQPQTALDDLSVQRNFTVELNGGHAVMRDTYNNIETFDFAFSDPNTQGGSLPGAQISPAWPPAAVSAHANASAVADFLRQVVKRNNLDDRGGAMNSSINCVVVAESNGHEWMNAYWNGDQMVYGQVMANGKLTTLAAALDIVGHEMFHGVTDNTSRLEYANQPGALNESYSDIFGLLIANRGNPNTSTWNWGLGAGFGTGGAPFRDMSNPPLFKQPDHMRDFKRLPNTDRGDYGGVHTNSGIHNKAAYLILVAQDAAGPIFTPDEVAAIFYLALTQQLSRTSQFIDSRRGVLISTQTYFRMAPKATLGRKYAAVEAAFTAVGIV